MSATPINCCHRGCTLAVWAPGRGGLEVNCSSATCMTCRRVALCLAHFESVEHARHDLRCVNCGGRRWYVCLFEPARLTPHLRSAIEAGGGRIEARGTRGGGRPTPDEAPDTRKPASNRRNGPPPLPRPPPPPDPRLRPWHWTPARAVPPDAHAAAPGVLVRRVGDHVRPVVDGVALDVTAAAIEAVSRAPSGAPDLVFAARPADRRTRIVWCDGAGHRIDLPPPLGGALHAPAFVDDHRFVYVAVADGRAELREATVDRATRIRTRRITALGPAPDRPPPPPAAFQHREAVAVFAATDEGTRPVRIRLADGHRSPLDDPQPLPRRLVAARRGSVAAWITPEGEVRCAGPGLSARVVGQTELDLLAVADDGGAVAWVVRDQLAIADPRRGDVQLCPLPEAITTLSWSSVRRPAPTAERGERARAG